MSLARLKARMDSLPSFPVGLFLADPAPNSAILENDRLIAPLARDGDLEAHYLDRNEWLALRQQFSRLG